MLMSTCLLNHTQGLQDITLDGCIQDYREDKVEEREEEQKEIFSHGH